MDQVEQLSQGGREQCEKVGLGVSLKLLCQHKKNWQKHLA